MAQMNIGQDMRIMESTKKSKIGKNKSIRKDDRTMRKSKIMKARYENLEDYSSLAINNPISNFEVDAKILVGFFNEEYIDIDEIYDRIYECRKDLEQIESGIPELEEHASMGKSAKKSKMRKSAIRKQKVEFYNDELYEYMKQFGYLVRVIDEDSAEQAIDNAIDSIQYDIENDETANYFFSGCEYYFDKDATMDLIRNEILDKLEESTKKSKYARLNKALHKLGGFTKEEDEEDVEIDIDVKGDDDKKDEEFLDETVQEIEGKPEDDSIEERCKSRKALRTRKYRKMRKEGINLPEDADDQQDINEKGSGNAGSELPEDADEVTEINEKGTGNAGSLLPEDADDQEDQKQSYARKRRKNLRKFSVTNGGSPDQTSYLQRYQQTPRMREAIDRHFTPGVSDVDMLQERINEMGKSRRNSLGKNGVPTRLNRR